MWGYWIIQMLLPLSLYICLIRCSLVTCQSARMNAVSYPQASKSNNDLTMKAAVGYSRWRCAIVQHQTLSLVSWARPQSQCDGNFWTSRRSSYHQNSSLQAVSVAWTIMATRLVLQGAQQLCSNFECVCFYSTLQHQTRSNPSGRGVRGYSGFSIAQYAFHVISKTTNSTKS